MRRRNGKVEETWIQSVNIYQVIPAENIWIRSKTISSSSTLHHRGKTRWNIFTFLRQPTRLLILFRCSFSPFPSLPAKIPTLWKTIISSVEIKKHADDQPWCKQVEPADSFPPFAVHTVHCHCHLFYDWCLCFHNCLPFLHIWTKHPKTSIYACMLFLMQSILKV